MGSTSHSAGHPTRLQARLAAAAIVTVGTGLGVGMAGIAPAAADPGNGNGNAYGITQGNANPAAPTDTPAATTPAATAPAAPHGDAGRAGRPGAGADRPGNGHAHGRGGKGSGASAPGHASGTAGQPHSGQSHAPSRGQGNAAPGTTDTSHGDPAGNNGTVKIAALGDLDGIPDNTPHPGCTFQVEWYGFDEGADVVSTVSFAEQAPTTGVGLTVDGPTEVFVGGDPATGAGTATGLDATQPYTLAFTGAPHPQQGYHVKLTVSTPRSIGNDTKTKVFWVEGCGPEAPAQPTTPPSESPAPGQSGAHPQGHSTGHGNPHVQPASDAEVLGEQAFAAPAVAAPAVKRVGAVLPTAVNAGVGGQSPVAQDTSLLATLLVLLGGVVGRLAWTRRARG